MTWCENKDPLFRLRIHSPANPMHRHIDTRETQLKFTAPTDWEAWVSLIKGSLNALGYGQSQTLSIGFYLDLINNHDETFRWTIVKGVFEGLGFGAEMNDVGEVEVNLPKKYEPLREEGEERITKGGVILPKGLEIPK